MPNDASTDTPPVVVISHPPEHGPRRTSAPAQAGPGCCCTCCCCLHSIGSLIGAIVAPRLGGPPQDAWGHLSLVDHWEAEDKPAAPAAPAATNYNPNAITEEAPGLPARPADSPRTEIGTRGIALSRSGFSAASIFWWTTLALVPILLGGSFLFHHGINPGDSLLIFVLLLLLGFPFMQLAALVVTALILAFSSRLDRPYQFQQLGKITMGVVAGAAFGMIAMLGLGMVWTEFPSWVFRWFLLSIFVGGGAVVGLYALSRRR